MARKPKMSAEQLAYCVAKAQYDTIRDEYRANERIFDAAYDAEPDYEGPFDPVRFQAFYAAWAAANPEVAAEAERLCAAQEAARLVLVAAEKALLSWCAAKVAPLATPEQRKMIADVHASDIVSVREKAVDLALRLAA